MCYFFIILEERVETLSYTMFIVLLRYTPPLGSFVQYTIKSVVN